MDRYDTKLSPADEQKFRQWAQSIGHAGDTQDYDLRGAWKAGAAQAENGHFPDTFKKPNHPTFSNESQYAKGMDAGSWSTTPDGQDVFTPGRANLQHFTEQQLIDYFKKREPNAILKLPTPTVEKYYGKPKQ